MLRALLLCLPRFLFFLPCESRSCFSFTFFIFVALLEIVLGRARALAVYYVCIACVFLARVSINVCTLFVLKTGFDDLYSRGIVYNVAEEASADFKGKYSSCIRFYLSKINIETERNRYLCKVIQDIDYVYSYMSSSN